LKRMHRICFFSVLFLAVLLLSGCHTELPAVQNINKDIAASQSTTPAAIEIVLSHSRSIGSPEDRAACAMRDKLQELLDEQAEVMLYADYQLGSAQEQLEAVQLGRVHITIQPVSAVSRYADDLKVFALPYLFSANEKEVIDVLDGPLAQEALDRIGMEQGEPAFKGLGLWFGGYKLFTFHGDENKHIHSPADFQGLTIATPDTPLLKAQYQHWGAEPIPIDAIALYSTLAQHIADGSEATVSQIAESYLYEVQHNIVQAYHSAEIYTVVVNRQWYEAQPADVQNAIIEAEAYGKEQLYQALDEQEAAYIDIIRQVEGMRYEELDENAIKHFKASTEPIYTEQLAGSPWQMDYVERIQKCFT